MRSKNIIQKQYRRQSARHKEFDYSEAGAYFITICTKAKTNYFTRYPALKDIVSSELESISHRFPTVLTDTFIVMPNHVHCIFILKTKNVGAPFEVAQRAGSSPAHESWEPLSH